MISFEQQQIRQMIQIMTTGAKQERMEKYIVILIVEKPKPSFVSAKSISVYSEKPETEREKGWYANIRFDYRSW